MVQKRVIARKIQTINDSFDFLKKYETIKYIGFENDIVVQSACLFHIEKLVQALIDIIMHLIAENGWGVYLHTRNTAEVLYKNKVIDKESQEKLIQITGFRNRLVHDYEETDLKIAYQILTSNKHDVIYILDQILNYTG